MDQARKLSAVMFTDIVGYTAMMARDEEHTIALVRTSRRLHESLVSAHHGEVIDVVGDGTLCCFPSALDAVRCGLALQRQLESEPDLRLRIGIHLGDIVFSGKNVFGDGVNVASRIQSAADPGSIHVSDQIYHQVKNRPEVVAEFLGQRTFKNVSDPVGVYAITGSEEETADRRISPAPHVAPEDEPRGHDYREPGGPEKSIAVLPFEDFSPEGDSAYFSDGLTEEIIADLSKIRALRVISRTSVMMLKGTDKDVPTIGRELGVQYLLEGSVRKAGSSLRITAQLIDATRDAHLWAEKYSGSIEDVFDIQENVSRAIVSSLRLSLSAGEEDAIGRREITNLQAHECLMRARSEMMKGTESSVARAFSYLNEANRLVGENVAVYSAMAEVYFTLFHVSGANLDEILGNMAELSERILRLDPDAPQGHFCKGLVQYKTPWGFREAARSFERAALLNPNDSSVLLSRGMQAMNAGRLALAEECAGRLLLLDPISPANLINRAFISLFSGDFEKAVEAGRKALAADPESEIWRWCLITSLAQMREVDEVHTIAEGLRRAPSGNFARLGMLYDAALRGDSAEFRQLLSSELMTTARRDETFSWSLAQCYSLLEDGDAAVEWLEVAVRYGFVHYPWLSEQDPLLENVRAEPGFQALMTRVKSEWEESAV